MYSFQFIATAEEDLNAVHKEYFMANTLCVRAKTKKIEMEMSTCEKKEGVWL